jgi:sortase A
MIKKLSILVILIGITMISFGGYEFVKTKFAQKTSLQEAKKIVQIEKVQTPKTDKAKEVVFDPKSSDVVGILEIPRIKAELPIVEGTAADDLEKGVGHYKGTAYPQGKDQIVLSGHRDTVFRRMGELKIGDELIMKLSYGSFTYRIESTKIVDADDRTVIVPTAPEEVLTVTTCYPFSYVGNAPKRYIITAKPKK